MGISENGGKRGKALMTPMDEAFAENLKYFREQSGITLAELARKVSEEFGVAWQASTIFKIENGRKVSIGEANMLASALQVSLDDLVNQMRAKGPGYMASIHWARSSALVSALYRTSEAIKDLRLAEAQLGLVDASIFSEDAIRNMKENHRSDPALGVLFTSLKQTREVLAMRKGDKLWELLWEDPKTAASLKELMREHGEGVPEKYGSDAEQPSSSEKYFKNVNEAIDDLLKRIQDIGE
jgi:transcriptional regulator with XRE-family HTH domain